jgi:hypothetical protein
VALDCTNTDALMEAAKCFKCIPAGMQSAVQAYLLAVIAGGSLDPNTLMQQAHEFQRIPKGMLGEIQVMLLCNIVNA